MVEVSPWNDRAAGPIRAAWNSANSGLRSRTSEPGPIFAASRIHLLRATTALTQLTRLWRTAKTEMSPEASVVHRAGATAELWCTFPVRTDLRDELNSVAATLVRSVKASMDASILSAATLGGRCLQRADLSNHNLPLFDSREDFERHVEGDRLRGLRRDQMQAVEDLQLYNFEGADPLGRWLRTLAAALDAIEQSRPVFSMWTEGADPLFRPRVQDLNVDPPSLCDQSVRVATFRWPRGLASERLAFNPQVYLVPSLGMVQRHGLAAEHFDKTGRGWILIARGLMHELEQTLSGGRRAEALAALEPLMPVESGAVWLPVEFNEPSEEAEARALIADSELELAAFQAIDHPLTYLRLQDGVVVGRRLNVAPRVVPGTDHGPLVESATRAAAAKWGLPDFVFQPKVVRKGSGVREVGDGTIMSGEVGIVLQVKARNASRDEPEKARRWLAREAAKGLAQGRGTIRNTLASETVVLRNLRDRNVTINGSAVRWVPVVVLDHPNPPPGVELEKADGHPSLTLLRSDWEFLWTQLRSPSAIVDYVHRVADEDPIELGTESHRYFDLAHRDRVATPSDTPAWMSNLGARTASLPLLPMDPADSSDEWGYAIFQGVLEDLAESELADESKRMAVLERLDRVAVGARAELGRLLLQRLIYCAQAGPAELRMQNRVMFVNGIHLTFTTMSDLTKYNEDFHQTWLLHRRQTFLLESGATGPHWPWTVGVLLTPRPIGVRPWDTTILATNAGPHFDADEYERLSLVLRSNDLPLPSM